MVSKSDKQKKKPKTKQNKKQKQKQKRSANFHNFPPSIFHLFSFNFYFFTSIFPFFLAPIFTGKSEKFPREKCLGTLCPLHPACYATVYSYLEFKRRYLKNLKLFSIGVNESFEPIVLRGKKADGFLLILKAFS